MEEKGKERKLPEVDVHVKVKIPPPDAHKVGRLRGVPARREKANQGRFSGQLAPD